MQTRGGGDKASIFSFCFVVTPVFFFLFCLLSNFALFLSKSIVIHGYTGMVQTVFILCKTVFVDWFFAVIIPSYRNQNFCFRLLFPDCFRNTVFILTIEFIAIIDYHIH